MLTIEVVAPAGQLTARGTQATVPVWRVTLASRELKRYRRQLGLPLERAAERLGVSVEAVRGLEEGRYTLVGGDQWDLAFRRLRNRSTVR